jgi:hypothetical protein
VLCLCASLRKLDFSTVTKSDRENAALLPKLNLALLERFAPATAPEIEKNKGPEIPANPLAANTVRSTHAPTAGGGGGGAGGGGATPTPSTATPTVTFMAPSALITAAAVGAGGRPRAGSRKDVDREGKEDGQEEEEEDITREIWGDSLPFWSCTSNARETMN